MNAIGLVLATGREDRLVASTPDALCVLDGLPLVAHAVRALTYSDSIREIVVSAPKGVAEEVQAALDASLPNHQAVVVAGPPALSSFAETCGAADVVVIHDIRRPLVPIDLVDRLLAAMCDGVDAVVPVVEVVETVKELDPDGWIVRTVPRDRLRQVQTPRAVRTRVLSDAMLRDGAEWEPFVASSSRVLTVAGDADAFALREPPDIELAAAILRARKFRPATL